MRQRPRVYEHRITRVRTPEFWKVRFWIESDPEYRGVTEQEARLYVSQAMMIEAGFRCRTTKDFAEFLLDHLTCVNSVEVCDSEGNGTAAHSEWP